MSESRVEPSRAKSGCCLLPWVTTIKPGASSGRRRSTRLAETMVFPRAKMLGATDEILTDNSVRSQGSPDTLPILERQTIQVEDIRLDPCESCSWKFDEKQN